MVAQVDFAVVAMITASLRMQDMIKKVQLTYQEALEELKGAYEREKIQLTAQISTLQVSVGQQQILMKRLESDLMQWIMAEGNLYNSASIIELHLDDGSSSYVSRATGEKLNGE